jgi:hypothetical protein
MQLEGIPSIPGIELCENYFDFSVDPRDFVNQRVLIVGKGNSAFETANHLTETAAVIHLLSPHPVKMAWQSHFVGNLRAVNNDFLDTYQLKSQNAVIDANLEQIERKDGQFVVHIVFSHARGQRRAISYDRVLVCTGFRFDDSIFDESCRPLLTLDNRFPDQTSAWESKNVGDLYFAGTLMQARDYKKTMSAFIHGFRYNIEILDRIFETRYHGKTWPYEAVAARPEAIVEVVLERIHRSSALFLQPGYLCDLLVVPEGTTGTVNYYSVLSADYVHEARFAGRRRYYTVSLEYGKFEGDPFNIERDPDPAKGHLAPYLHPVIRCFSDGFLVKEFHMQDDLENNFYYDEHVQPLLDFFREEFSNPFAS